MQSVGLGESLYEILSGQTVEMLKPLARRCGSNAPTRKEELVQFILRALRSPDFVASQVRQADEPTRLALAEVAHGDGSLDPGRLEAKYGMEFKIHRHSGWGSSYSRRNSTASVADLFFHKGRLPAELKPLLRAVLPAPGPFVVPTRDELPETLPGVGGDPVPLSPLLTEEAALHDLLAALTLAGQGKLAVSEATRQPTATTVRLLRERFLVPDLLPPRKGARADDAIRPFALAMIVQAAGLVRFSGGRLALTKTGQAALDAPSPDLLKECWEAWVGWDKFDELSRIRAIKGQKSRRSRLTPPSDRKEAIDQALATCPQGRWIPIEGFLRHVRANNHDFDVETTEQTGLYVGSSQEYGWLGYSPSSLWDVVHGSYIRAILLEYAATLGLIDVATISPEDADLDLDLVDDAWGFDEPSFSRYDGLAYLRINNLGSYILEQSDHYEGPAILQEQPALMVLPSLDVVVTHRTDLTPNERAVLERFTTRVSDDVYKLSRERLLDAVEEGLAVAEAEEFLRRRSRQDLPQTVQVLLQDTARGAAAVQGVGSALLVRCADPVVAQLIAHDAALGKLCLPAGENHLVVPDKHIAAFRRGLKRLGYALPAGK